MRIRFTIRDLLWLAVVVALAVGWSVNVDRVAKERDQARRAARDFSNTLDRYRAAYTTQPAASAPNLFPGSLPPKSGTPVGDRIAR